MLKSTLGRRLISLALASVALVRAQYGPYGEDDGSYPHSYPGIPTGDFSPEWQSYFQVTERLPNVTFDLGRNWAGNIPVNRADHPNNSLFFWAFEKESGSLTAAAGERSDEPWGIYINTAGTSGLFGLAFDNGPLQIASDYTVHKNNFSWDHLADWIWVDQSVGTGFSTADPASEAKDEDQAAQDFIGFLSNLVKVFPSLKTRPLYFTGSSGATVSMTYFAQNYFALTDPPVNLRKLAIANAIFGPAVGESYLPSVLQTYPQLIGYNTSVYEYFQRRIHECGYDLNLTYPPTGKYPTLHFGPSTCGDSPDNCTRPSEPLKGQFACGGLINEMTIYTGQSAPPWNISDNFDSYDLRDALNPEVNMDGSVFFNDNATRAALHAPTSKNWFWTNALYYGDPNTWEDPSPPPSELMDALAANAEKHDVPIVFYNSNDDLTGHFNTELNIQNFTFGGIQGFTRKPATPWTDDNGQFAGVVHQERNWTYILIDGVSHYVSRRHPERAYVMIREFVLGNNQTGLVTEVNGVVSVVGGEDNSLYVNGILPGQEGIFFGNGTIQGEYTYPSATIEAWKSYSATAFATATPTAASKVSARFRISQ